MTAASAVSRLLLKSNFGSSEVLTSAGSSPEVFTANPKIRTKKHSDGAGISSCDGLNRWSKPESAASGVEGSPPQRRERFFELLLQHKRLHKAANTEKSSFLSLCKFIPKNSVFAARKTENHAFFLEYQDPV